QPETVKEEVIQLGEYQFNHHRHTLTREGTEKKLTNREAELLHLFCRNANRTIDRTHTLQSLWGDDSYFNARSMDVFVSRLRKLLKHDPNIELVNVRGKGYKLLIWEH
ncbi:MAG: winged helix-turn-helix domain-containing protein, partial [Bacteroidota bacterium]